ncbi:MAG: hypothetical protein BLM47_06970 [Candidatus Reconcilbacillus cellulovorans]|uniref:DNA-binding response regulator n=1 Tax=Candidatus Reconcilbacillus cellulovorans TaxID=1906605 RepID=A0A2A6DZH9_9BACL|nr:MAG: hypothetical protein BLM47_06970 [Candidatus Reconcilbacillus cellulovorans]
MISDRTYSVVLVDDEPFAREGLKRLIDWKACGFEICGEAADGQEALDLIERLRPDVAVVDLRMPGLDGLEVVRIAAEERRLPVRFLIASGYGEFDYARRAMRYGVCDFLTKPIDPDELCDALETVRRKLEEKMERLRPAGAQNEADAPLWLERLVALSIVGGSTPIVATARKTELGGGPADGEANTDLSADAPAGLNPVCYAIVERNEPWRPQTAGSGGVRPKALSAEWTKAGFLRAVKRLCGRDVRVISHMPAHDRIGFLVEAAHLAASGLGLREFLAELRRALAEEWSAPAAVYAGTPVGGVGELALSVRSAWAVAARAYDADDGGGIFGSSASCGRKFQKPAGFAQVGATDEERIRAFIEEAEAMPDERLPDTVRRLIDDMLQSGLDTDTVRQTACSIVRHFAALVASLGGDAASMPALREALSSEDARRTRADLEAMLVDVAREASACLRRLRRECGLPRAVRAFVDEHYGEPLSLKTVSKRFYVNAAHLGRTFKRAFGLSFGDYLFEVRLREAKKLLRDTDLRVSEIAERVGFRNADYFSARFFRAVRMTPTEYRNRFRTS